MQVGYVYFKLYFEYREMKNFDFTYIQHCKSCTLPPLCVPVVKQIFDYFVEKC